ncbi:unnamed protein product [Ectocarpus sp. CCAP 1310/34]|nr:unnamed protein product [Ectocarpus sp. CCAP 1310/34]
MGSVIHGRKAGILGKPCLLMTWCWDRDGDGSADRPISGCVSSCLGMMDGRWIVLVDL